MTTLPPDIDYCRAIVRSWEPLRVLYNAVLLLPGIALILRFLHLQDEVVTTSGGTAYFTAVDPVTLVAGALVFGVASNICYCLGPYLEFVISAMGFPLSARRTRFFFFAMGLLLSLGVVGLAWLQVEFFFAAVLVTGP